jgi:gluconokinase
MVVIGRRRIALDTIALSAPGAGGCSVRWFSTRGKSDVPPPDPKGQIARAPTAQGQIAPQRLATPLASPVAPRAIIVMGVSGSGKSTLGPLLAGTLNCQFLEGDAFHGPDNVAKMSAGQPLQDEDRWPWLDRLGAALNGAVTQDGIGVAACSALKRRYRERLAQAVSAPVSFVFLRAERDELTRRLNNRPGHYMPASLIASQFDALEPPEPDEPALALDASAPPQELCGAACAWLAQASRHEET